MHCKISQTTPFIWIILVYCYERPNISPTIPFIEHFLNVAHHLEVNSIQTTRNLFKLLDVNCEDVSLARKIQQANRLSAEEEFTLMKRFHTQEAD